MESAILGISGSKVASTRLIGDGLFAPGLETLRLVISSPPVAMRLITVCASSSKAVPWLSRNAPGRSR